VLPISSLCRHRCSRQACCDRCGWLVIDLDASLITAWPDKEGEAPTPKAIHKARKRASSFPQVGSADPYRFGQQIQGIAGGVRVPGTHGLDQFGPRSRREICVPVLSGLPGRQRLLVAARPLSSIAVARVGVQGHTYFCCKIECNLAVKGVYR
jgi:hypothetical protein